MIKIREGINLLDLLSRSGHTTYTLRKEGLIGEVPRRLLTCSPKWPGASWELI